MMHEKLADLLVVDEDERTRGAEQRWMRLLGYEAFCLPSGLAALHFLDTYRPKYAVLDVTTLGDEGLDVLEVIRRRPSLRDLAVVVHVAVPDGAGFRSQAYLTRGIDWLGMRVEAEKYLQ
jgi:ActR/RegA family two-component response regulator